MRVRAGPVILIGWVPYSEFGWDPLYSLGGVYYVLYDLVYDILGNSLSFVLMVFSLCFRYFSFQGEGPGMITEHTPPCSAFCDSL